MNVTINTSIEELHDKDLITTRCKEVLLQLNLNDSFDVMTTRFPEKPLNYSKKTKKEIKKLVNKLYKS